MKSKCDSLKYKIQIKMKVILKFKMYMENIMEIKENTMNEKQNINEI